jgi:hypothetical protein
LSSADFSSTTEFELWSSDVSETMPSISKIFESSSARYFKFAALESLRYSFTMSDDFRVKSVSAIAHFWAVGEKIKPLCQLLLSL